MFKTGWYSLTLVLLLVGAFALLAGCSSGTGPVSNMPARDPSLQVDSNLVAATNNFAFRLNQQLVSSSPNANVFFSPASVEMALALVANGAQGQTATDIATTLGTQNMSQAEVNSGNAQLLALLHDPDQLVTLNIANGVWCNKGDTYNTSFLQAAQQWYGADPQYLALGPSAVAPIDAWIAAQTAQMIPQLFAPGDIPSGSPIVFANAIYFKGRWTTQFNPQNTTNGTFTNADNSTQTVPFMSVTAPFNLLTGANFQGVDLPYGNKYVSMLVIEPNAGVSLSTIIPELTCANWTPWLAAESPTEVTVQLPKFSASFGSSLVNTLTAMGMGSAFNPAQGFTGILSSASPVSLAVLKHQAVLDVDETGTTAAAATGGAGATAVVQSTTVRFDHPFVVIIHDIPTGTILFMGEIADPQAA